MTDVCTKFEVGRSRCSRVIDRKRKGYRQPDGPTCAKQYALSSSKGGIINSQCIGGSMKTGILIPWIAHWTRVHINKAEACPLSLYISKKLHTGVENGPKKALDMLLLSSFCSLLSRAIITNYLSTYIGLGL